MRKVNLPLAPSIENIQAGPTFCLDEEKSILNHAIRLDTKRDEEDEKE